jgi:hypothetical protein
MDTELITGRSLRGLVDSVVPEQVGTGTPAGFRKPVLDLRFAESFVLWHLFEIAKRDPADFANSAMDSQNRRLGSGAPNSW